MTPKKRKLPAWTTAFLAALAEVPSVSDAAAAAGISRQAAYKLRDQNPEFAEAWREALASGVESLEAAAWRRAKADSDTLAIFLLKAHKPELYREKVAQEHSGGMTFRVEYVRHHPDAAGAAPGAIDDPLGNPALERRRVWAALRENRTSLAQIGGDGASG